MDGNGRPYYYNSVDKQTTWTRPPPPPRDAPQGQRRKRAKPAPAAPLYRTRDAETAPSVFAQPGVSMFSPTFAQGMMLAELNASRAREQSERESQARFLGFMGVPK